MFFIKLLCCNLQFLKPKIRPCRVPSWAKKELDQVLANFKERGLAGWLCVIDTCCYVPKFLSAAGLGLEGQKAWNRGLTRFKDEHKSELRPYLKSFFAVLDSPTLYEEVFFYAMSV